MADRLEREIDEILRKADSLPEARKRLRPGRWTRFKRGIGARLTGLSRSLAKLSLGHVMIAGFVLIVVGVIADGAFGTWALVGGLVLLLTAFVVSLSRGRRPTTPNRQQEVRWRGRVIQMDEPTLGDRVRGLWRRKKR